MVMQDVNSWRLREDRVPSLPLGILETGYCKIFASMPKRKPAHGHIVHHPRQQAPMNHCFACGKDNDQGMKLKFYFDEESRHAICKFRLGRRFTGPPEHAHGGIIATILDEAMGKVNKLRNVIALTKNMNVEYLKPVPLGKTLTVTVRQQQVEGSI